MSGPCRISLDMSANDKAVGLNVGLRSEEHTSELQSRLHLVCRLLLEKKKSKLRAERPAEEELVGRLADLRPPQVSLQVGPALVLRARLAATAVAPRARRCCARAGTTDA